MADMDFKEALESAITKLAKLVDERTDLEKKIAVLDDRIERTRQGVLGLSNLAECDFDELKEKYPDLFDDTVDPRLGLTDAVRQVMKSAGKYLTPFEVRDGVYKIYPALSGHKNPLASLYTVLKRLVDNDEVTIGIEEETSKMLYGWTEAIEARQKAREEAKKSVMNKKIKGEKE
jgi:hypothetical protein